MPENEEVKPTTEAEVKVEPDKQKAQERMLVPVEDTGEFSHLLDTHKFAHLQRLGHMFASSDLVPEHYKGKVANCTIGIAAAIRLQIDPLMFLQKTYIVQGRPGMEAQLAIALVNSRGRLKTGLHYRLEGEGDDRGCVAWGVDKDTGETLEGPRVTIAMAKGEGWYGDDQGWKEGKNGSKYRSKWYTLRDLMLTYRSATFFARVHRPESLLGFALLDELEDIEHSEPRDVTPESERPSSAMPPMPKEKETEVEVAQPQPLPASEVFAKAGIDPVKPAIYDSQNDPEGAAQADAYIAEKAKAADAAKDPEVVIGDAEVKALWKRYRQIFGSDDSHMRKYLESVGRASSKSLTMQELADYVKQLDQAAKDKEKGK